MLLTCITYITYLHHLHHFHHLHHLNDGTFSPQRRCPFYFVAFLPTQLNSEQHMNLKARSRTVAAIATAVTAAIAVPGKTFAAGFALLEQSGSRLGSAFAGTTVVTEDASVMFYNPAGLAKLEGTQLAAVVSGIALSSEFNNRNSQPAFGHALGTEGGDAGDWNAVPSVYFAIPINDDLSFGFGFNVPFGLKLEYSADWIGRFQAINSEIQTYNFNPALAWEINDVVTIGIGANYQRIQAELTNDVNYTAVIAQGAQQLAEAGQLDAALVPGIIAANAGLEGGTRVRGDDSTWGFNIGVLFQLSPDTRLGLAYRSTSDYEVEGSVRFDPVTATDPFGVGQGILNAAAAGRLAPGPISVDLELPDTATASLSHRIGRIELLADIAWTGWSSVQELRIVRSGGEVLSVTPEEWDDTWRFAVGASYEMSDSLKLRAGLAYDETPVPDSTRTARLPDTERTWVAIGAQWKLSDAFTLDAGYAHLFSDDVPLDQDQDSIPTYGLLNGEQESAVDIVSVQATYRF